MAHVNGFNIFDSLSKGCLGFVDLNKIPLGLISPVLFGSLNCTTCSLLL